jgi:hypothetical protein
MELLSLQESEKCPGKFLTEMALAEKPETTFRISTNMK